MKPLLITSGEPAGLGPDLCLLVADEFHHCIVVMGDGDLLTERAKRLNIEIQLTEVGATERAQPPKPGQLSFIHHPLNKRAEVGKPDIANVPYLLELHNRAAELCLNGSYGALITAPTDKKLINEAGEHFTDLTSYLRQLTNSLKTLSIFVGNRIGNRIDNKIKVAFITMHIPLMQVGKLLSKQLVKTKILMTHQAIQHYFSCPEPRLALCGLNPHGGEGGLLGQEEKVLLTPLADQLRAQDINLAGPLSADSLFAFATKYDAIIAIYHDQGLAPFKALTFGQGAQWTYGLPFIRTSPDHGTAYAIAGSKQIDYGSMKQAIRLAIELSQRDAEASPAD